MDKKLQQYCYEKVPLLIAELNERLIERDHLSRLVVLAMLSKNHMFLIGERGVAKTLTVSYVGDTVEGAVNWEKTLSEETSVVDLVGKKEADENGVIRYVSKQSILHAHYIIFNEMFKARGRVLESMLELLEERTFTEGDGTKKQTPLFAVFGTSNEYPTDERMMPYVDRFLFWVEVERIKEEKNKERFFLGDYVKDKITNKYFSVEMVSNICKNASKITIPKEIVAAYREITDIFIRQGVKTSDRKYGKILTEVIKVSAFINNRDSVDLSDLFLLKHTAWHNDIEKAKVNRVVNEYLFGAKEAIETEIYNISNYIESVDTSKNTYIYDYLNYKKAIDTADNMQEYANIILFARNILSGYQKALQATQRLHNNYIFNKDIERMTDDNIFLKKVIQDSFSNESIEDINKINKVLTQKISTLSQWITQNETLHLYNKNLHNKNQEVNK